jgi:hypothetical protein
VRAVTGPADDLVEIAARPIARGLELTQSLHPSREPLIDPVRRARCREEPRARDGGGRAHEASPSGRS